MRMLRIDIWGGDLSQELVASTEIALASRDAWQSLVAKELGAGYLVNLRVLEPHEGHGAEAFDTRFQIGKAGVT